MGKVHRIKKSFRKLVAQEPVQTGRRRLSGVTIHLGRNDYGHLYAVTYYGGYEKLVQSLIREYNGRAM